MNPYENLSEAEILKMTGLSSLESTAVETREIAPGVVLVTMQDRAGKNTFTMELIVGLYKAFQEIQENESYKAVILTGYDNYFACGGGQDGLLALHEGRMKMTDVNIYTLPMDCKIPVIAAMQGHGIGGGLCFGLFSDFVVMSRESSYTCNHMKYGFTPGDGATLIIPERLGSGVAQEMLFTGNRYRGSELQAKGATVPILPRKEVLPYAIQLAKDLAEVPRDSLVLLKQHRTEPIRRQLAATLDREWEMQQQTFVSKPEILQKILSAFDQTPPTTKQEPEELLLLNRGGQGTPVFWIHGEGGGVEGYQVFAQKSRRPFYGIQAHGRMNNLEPIRGLEQIAAHYVGLIRSVQPEGPYDLGGYSLGGTLAYEIARLLQEAGQSVRTLLMLDALDATSLKRVELSRRSQLLQAINLSLLSRIRQEGDKLLQKLIHPQDVQDVPDDELLAHLIVLGRERGLSTTKTAEELQAIFAKNLQIQEAYEAEQFAVRPLPRPEEVTCYYFRNQSGRFYGAFEPYLTSPEDRVNVDGSDYWAEWQQVLPNFHIVDAEASNHITLLFEPTASLMVATFCEILYQA